MLLFARGHHGLHRRQLPVRDRAQADRDAKEVCQPRLRGALGQMRRPRARRRDHRSPAWDRRDLLPLGLGILSPPEVLTVRTPPRRERIDHVDRFSRDQRPPLPRMARWPARATATCRAAPPLAPRLGWIGPGGRRSVPRVAPQPPGPLVDGRLLRRHFAPPLRELGPLPP
jgi:hypothetical protein